MKRGRWKASLFIIQNIGGTLLFFALPLCYCLLFSLSASFGRFRFNSFHNYVSLFRSETFLLALQNTFLLLFVFVVLGIALAVLLTFWMDRKPGFNWILLLCAASMFLPSAVVVNCAEAFPTFCEKYPAVLFGLIFLWRHVGINTLILHIAACNMDRDLPEAAALDGASKLGTFCRVVFFYLLPHIKFLFVLGVIGFFRMFRESYLLFGLYPPNEVYMMQNFFFNNFQNLNYQRLSAGATVTVLLLLLVNWILLGTGEKHEIV